MRFKCLTLASHTEFLISVNPSGNILHTVREKEKNYPSDQSHQDVVQPYAAYSPPGAAKVKYCHSQSNAHLDCSKVHDHSNSAVHKGVRRVN